MRSERVRYATAPAGPHVRQRQTAVCGCEVYRSAVLASGPCLVSALLGDQKGGAPSAALVNTGAPGLALHCGWRCGRSLHG